MANVVSALTARTQLRQILKRVKNHNERFVIHRRGEPQAIILSLADYVDTIAPGPTWLKRIGEASRRRRTSTLTMRDIDRVIDDTRRQRRKRSR